MRYLLDTHVILWWLTEPKTIHAKARHIIQDKTNQIYLSSASFWEMAIKKSIGRLIFPSNLLEVLMSEGFKILSINPEECLCVADLPRLHADPFDRLLITQAKFHDLILVTRDTQMSAYPVVTLEA